MPENEPPSPSTTPPTGTPPATNAGFTQDQVNDLAGRARNEGRQSAQRDLLDALGVKDVDEAKGALAQFKEIQDKNKDELTKAADRATKAESDLETIRGDHTTATLHSRVERVVLAKLLGDNAGLLDRASIILRLVDVDSKAEDKDITSAVEALAKTMPEIFAVNGAGAGGDGSGGTGKPPGRPAPPPSRPAPGGGSGPASPADAARTRLHERHPRTDKN